MKGSIITGEYCLGGHYSPQHQVSEFIVTTMHPNKPDHKDQEWHAHKAKDFSKFQSCGLFDRVTCLLVTELNQQHKILAYFEEHIRLYNIHSPN